METQLASGPAERAYWRAVGLVTLGSLLLAALFVLAAGMAAQTLWQGWSSGQPVDWQTYWASAHIAIAAGLWACVGPGLIAPMHGRMTQANKVRRAVHAADDEMAPLAELLPSNQPSTDVPVGPTLFASFRRRPQRWVPLLMVYTFTYGYWVLLGMSGNWVGAWPPRTQVPFGAIPLDLYPVGVMLLMFTCATVVVFSIWRALLAFDAHNTGRLAVDDAGVYRLEYRGERRTVSIRWSEARAFWMLRPSTEWRRVRYPCFALDSGSHLITWGFPAHTGTSAEWHEHNRLCALITMRTGLPLRDLTDAADARHVWLNVGLPLLTRRVPRLLRWLILVSVVLDLVLTFLLSISAWTVQHIL
jgi:hypothetical protein